MTPDSAWMMATSLVPLQMCSQHFGESADAEAKINSFIDEFAEQNPVIVLVGMEAFSCRDEEDQKALFEISKTIRAIVAQWLHGRLLIAILDGDGSSEESPSTAKLLLSCLGEYEELLRIQWGEVVVELKELNDHIHARFNDDGIIDRAIVNLNNERIALQNRDATSNPQKES